MPVNIEQLKLEVPSYDWTKDELSLKRDYGYGLSIPNGEWDGKKEDRCFRCARLFVATAPFVAFCRDCNLIMRNGNNNDLYENVIKEINKAEPLELKVGDKIKEVKIEPEKPKSEGLPAYWTDAVFQKASDIV